MGAGFGGKWGPNPTKSRVFVNFEQPTKVVNFQLPDILATFGPYRYPD